MFDFLKRLGIGQKAFNPNVFSFFYNQASPKLGEKQLLDAYKGMVFKVYPSVKTVKRHF